MLFVTNQRNRLMKKLVKENWIVRYWKFLRHWRAQRDAIKQLNRLTDKQLKDIGINRGDIDRLVWLEEDKTMRGRG